MKINKTDEHGQEYATLSADFNTKNTPGGLGGREFQTCGRIQDPTQVSALRRLLAWLHPLQDGDPVGDSRGGGGGGHGGMCLKDAGFSPNEICAVTGHKDERSLQPYDRLDRAGCDRPRAMADVLDGKPGGHGVQRRMNDSPKLGPSPKRPCGDVLDKIVLNDQAVIHSLTINVGTTTALAQHNQQSLSCSSSSQSGADLAQELYNSFCENLFPF